ncbi:MAG: hydantoinase/oxoprolinase family protein [Pseudomonadota bacterium]
MKNFVAVDTGGTFTDLVSFNPDSGDVKYTKSLTTHHNPIEGILACADKTDTRLESAAIFKHGTTLVINTLLERSGPEIALVTTRGFRDVVELGRGNRAEPFNLYYRRDPALVPRVRRFEVTERVNGSGQSTIAPNEAEVRDVAESIRASGAEAVAVSFINSYLEPAHELLVASLLRTLLPECFITTGAELSREWYEYERTATATANAYAGPKIGGYIASLGGALAERKFKGRFYLMGSNGGVLSAAHAAKAPVLLVESGPIGGCIGASAFGIALGIDNIIAFDMGGTTAKCALVESGEFAVDSIYYVGGYGRGIPIRAPVVDIVEVGAGGGSIAWLDEQKRLRVGPKSAGSTPGPACYGRGGSEPTVTDANLLLGRLNAQKFQGGEMALDVERAASALESKIGETLGYQGRESLLELADGILSIAAVIMAGAIKRITIERGRDPRDFVLFAYGGGGPLHSAGLARAMNIPMVIIPPEPGNFSAIGMLLADIRRDIDRTVLRAIDENTISDLERTFADMEAQLAGEMTADFPDIAIEFKRSVEMRFVGQMHTVRVPVLATDTHTILNGAFQAIYQKRYGHVNPNGESEVVSLHTAAHARTPRPEIGRLAVTGKGAPPAPGTRPIYFSEAKAELHAAVFERATLPIGFASPGPAVIEEYGSTTIVGPFDTFEVGALGELRLHIGKQK